MTTRTLLLRFATCLLATVPILGAAEIAAQSAARPCGDRPVHQTGAAAGADDFSDFVDMLVSREGAEWRKANRLRRLPAGTRATLVADTADCRRLAAAVDEQLRATRRGAGYWSVHAFSSEYAQIGPYYVVMLAEDLPDTDAEGRRIVRVGAVEGNYTFIFDRDTFRYRPLRVPLVQI
jgi:hypothetical protein